MFELKLLLHIQASQGVSHTREARLNIMQVNFGKKLNLLPHFSAIIKML